MADMQLPYILERPRARTKQAELERNVRGSAGVPVFPAWEAVMRMRKPPSASNHVSKPEWELPAGPSPIPDPCEKTMMCACCFQALSLG